MGDTKEGREKQAADENRRQQERDLSETRARADEPEPPDADAAEFEADGPDGEPRTCHRRGCNETATFLAMERYLEETGHGAVESTAVLCRDHAAEESPTNLDDAYPDYVFRVEPLPQ